MSSIQMGGCLCGATRYEITGKLQFTIQCFCRDCQRVSGGGNLPLYVVKQEDFDFIGPMKYYARKSGSGNDQEFGFCGDCGCPISSTNSKVPEKIFIMAGSLDDPSIFSTENKIHESSRQPWDKI